MIVFSELEAANQRLVETQRRVHRALGTVATSRRRLELEIRRLEQQVPGPGGPGRAERQLDELRLQYAATELHEERVAAASRRLQDEITTFREARRTIEAAYTAAEEAAESI